MTEVYNILPNLSGNKVIKSLLMDSVPRSVKVVPAFIERHNIIASSSKVKLGGEIENIMLRDVEEIETSEFMVEGDVKISIPPFACYFKFVISKRLEMIFSLFHLKMQRDQYYLLEMELVNQYLITYLIRILTWVKAKFYLE